MFLSHAHVSFSHPVPHTLPFSLKNKKPKKSINISSGGDLKKCCLKKLKEQKKMYNIVSGMLFG